MIVTVKTHAIRPKPVDAGGEKREGIRLLSSYLGIVAEPEARDPAVAEEPLESPFDAAIIAGVDDDEAEEDEEEEFEDEEEEDDDFDFDDDEDDDFDEDEDEEFEYDDDDDDDDDEE